MKAARFKGCCCFLFGLVWFILPMVSDAADRDDLRGQRYCEVLVSKGWTFDVYSTIFLNDCPQALWDKITVQDIKEETGAFYVYLNGPRKFTMDGVKHTSFIDARPMVVVFHNLAMRKAGILRFSLRDILLGTKPYREHHVERNTIWIYKAGKPVYELIDPSGTVFVMQSFVLVSGQQTEDDLSQLGARIALPKGWTFKTGVLQQDRALKAIDHKATVVQDSIGNTYQKASCDFL